MKKWIDDLYAILIKRGFNTLDNVLKKYKSQIEDYEEIQINGESIILQPDESITIDLSNYYNIYDRYTIYNRGNMDSLNFICNFYKYTENLTYRYATVNQTGNQIQLAFESSKNFTITNASNTVKEINLYIKKIC